MPEQKKKTYRELVQDIYNDLNKLYRRAGGLRDAAEGKEKDIFNETRGVIGDLLSKWDKFEGELSEDRADMIIGDWHDSLK